MGNLSDSAAAIENLMLAAWDKGLGTCWMTGPLKARPTRSPPFWRSRRNGARGHYYAGIPG